MTGNSTMAATSKRFMTLEDECNWILSGREPLPDADGDESDQDDDTLDDISGDEVPPTTTPLLLTVPMLKSLGLYLLTGKCSNTQSYTHFGQ